MSRRTALQARAAGLGAVGLTGAATAHDGENDDVGADNDEDGPTIDEPDGFEVEVVGGHATFPDEVAQRLRSY